MTKEVFNLIDLSECIEFIRNGSNCEQSENGAYPITRIETIWNGKIDISRVKYCNPTVDEVDKYKLLPGDILFSHINSPEHIGKTAIYEGEPKVLIHGINLLIIRPNKNLIFPKFLNFYFKSPEVRKFFRVRCKKAVNQASLNQQDIKQVKIPVPPLDKQKEIASVLEKAEKAIQKRKKADELTERYLKSVFIEMFGHPVINPKGWEVKKLKNISTKILSGNTPKGGSEVYVDEGIMFFRSQNVWKSKLVLDDIAYIDKETHNKMIKSSLKYRDILMTKTGRINTENSSLGRAAMFIGEDDSANINGHVYLIRLKKNIINEFVLFILTTDEYREYIRSICVGGIDKRQINKEHLEEFPIIFPPLELQIQFADIVQKVETLKHKQKESSEELDTLFKSLMQKAFRGELTADDADFIDTSKFSIEGFKRLIKSEFTGKEFNFDELNSAISKQYENIRYEEIKMTVLACLEKQKIENKPFLSQIFNKESKKVVYKIN